MKPKPKTTRAVRPFITLFHHKHGTSFALIAAKDDEDAEKRAERFWIKTDGMSKDPDERAEVGEFVEVGEAVAPNGYELSLRRVR